MSTIAKHRMIASLRLGAEIRRQREARGLTQTELGRPLTRAFVSSVEHGRCLPSLAALAHFASRLHMSPADLLHSVNQDLAALYTEMDGPDGESLSGP